jgi:hypothetical protein
MPGGPVSQRAILEAEPTVDVDAARLFDTIRLLRAAVGKEVPRDIVWFVLDSTPAERLRWARRLAVNGALALEQVFAEPIIVKEFFDALTKRFGNLSPEVRAAIHWVDPGMLQEWRPDIEKVASPEALVFRTMFQKVLRHLYHCMQLEDRLRERFDEVPSPGLVMRIHGAKVEQLKEWRVRAETADSLEAVFAG